MTSLTQVHINAREVTRWSQEALAQLGVPSQQASLVANSLVQTSLWGIDSHGIARLPHYLSRLKNGTIKAKPDLKFENTASAVGNLNGDHGLGIVVCEKAMQHAIALARESGVGVVGVNHSTHCGAIGLYTRQAVREGMIGFALTHSDALVVPHLGNKPFFGTNPISFAIPSDNKDEPVCVDMATSVVPWNKVVNARRNAESIPTHWGIDASGMPSNDPHQLIAVNPMGEHKGYALAFLVDMLCGPLNGMPFGPHIPSMYKELEKQRFLGSFFLALDPLKFPGGASLGVHVAKAIRELKLQGTQVLFPGEPEYKAQKERARQGIPFEQSVLEQFEYWSEQLSVSKLVHSQ